MADEQLMGQHNAATEIKAESAALAKKPRKSPPIQKAKSRQDRSDANNGASPPTVVKARRYSEAERTEKLGEIEAQISGGATLKAAAKGAGISEQTYYKWKREVPAKNPVITKPSSEVDTLSDLIELDAENKRLRGLLAEKLHAENAELRKRLGMA